MNGRNREDNAAVDRYVAVAKKIPRLNLEQEVALAQIIEEVDEQASKEAMGRLAMANLILVLKIAERYKRSNPKSDLWDLIQDGNFGLMQAIKNYEWRKHIRFSTYATPYIEGAIKNIFRRPRWRIKSSLNALVYPRDEESTTIIDTLVDKKTPAPEASASEMSLHDLVAEKVEKLKPKQRKVIEHRFGLRGRRPKTLREIGQKDGITREAVRQQELEALDRLRRFKVLEEQYYNIGRNP